MATALVLGTIGLVVFIALTIGLSGSSSTGEVSGLYSPDPDAGPAISGLFVDDGSFRRFLTDMVFGLTYDQSNAP